MTRNKTGTGGGGSPWCGWPAGPAPDCGPPPAARRGARRPGQVRGAARSRPPATAPLLPCVPSFDCLLFWPGPRPARRRRPAHPHQARPLSRASRLPRRPSRSCPGNGRLTGPEPVRAVLSRRPAGKKPPELSRRPETGHSQCLRRDEYRAIPGQPGSLPASAARATGSRPGYWKVRAYRRLGAGAAWPEPHRACAQIAPFCTVCRAE
jgi:hypothetical protein